MAIDLPHNLHVSFDGVDGESLLMAFGDIAVSRPDPPAVRQPAAVARPAGDRRRRRVPAATIRFGLGRPTTEADIDYTIEKFA